MTIVTRLRDTAPEAEPANDLHLRTLLTGAVAGPDVSVTWVQLAGRHRRLLTRRSDRVYAVTDGSITLQVGTDPAVDVGPGDVAVVPCGTAYELDGVGTYLVINTPAFVDGDDVYDPEVVA